MEFFFSTDFVSNKRLKNQHFSASLFDYFCLKVQLLILRYFQHRLDAFTQNEFVDQSHLIQYSVYFNSTAELLKPSLGYFIVSQFND